MSTGPAGCWGAIGRGAAALRVPHPDHRPYGGRCTNPAPRGRRRTTAPSTVLEPAA
ncbi:hypothetical protein [Streptomyces microflavus]|uniref:hypothetical protein n=1 Tax=Streptomyces microflavus TaxID=1919 RepID=UPI003B222316